MSQKDLGEMLIVDALGRIDDKLEKLDDRLDTQGQILMGQASSLEEHVKRTNLLEKRIEQETTAIRAELPKHVQEEIRVQRNKMLVFIAKVGGSVLAVGGGSFGAAHGIKKLLEIWLG